METLEIIYHLDKNRIRDSYTILQSIKEVLMTLARGYTQITDSVTSPTVYTLTSHMTEAIADRVKEELGKITNDGITITSQQNVQTNLHP